MPDDAPRAVNVVQIEGLTHRYGGKRALDDLSLALPAGSEVAIIGPDGVGKSTLLGLVAGARAIQTGRLLVLGGNMADRRHRDRAAPSIAFMPQGLGKNLYPRLSVTENMDFFASLYAVDRAQWRARRDRLLKATGLDPFPDRAAGKLSGGMRQKLSLCCALVHDPKLLILDEPTTGIDPLSRRQFWELIDGIRTTDPELTLIVATAYMEEAERFGHLVVMDSGRILAAGPRAEVLAQAGASSIEQAFVTLRHGGAASARAPAPSSARPRFDGPPAIFARELTCRFGDFTAVDRVSFEIARGEIFGFLGSNGCGKTTTMKMLTGLTPPTSGEARLLGQPVDAADIETRRRVGYMSQSFSLYGELTVRQNVDLHANLYRLPDRSERVAETLARFDLEAAAASMPGDLPLGLRQRLQLATACLHRPDVLILDEPTSGVDPETRDRFWNYLGALSRDDGVTIFVSTHFLEEAERCDRVSFMHQGQVLAMDTPAALKSQAGAKTLEEAFITVLERHAPNSLPSAAPPVEAKAGADAWAPRAAWPIWVWAFAMREWREVVRDPLRLAFAFAAPLLLLVTFARGISFDIEALPFAVFDRDRSAESLSLGIHLAGSRYFAERAPALSEVDVDRKLQSGDAALVVEIPPGFGRDLLRGHQPVISLWLDGANPARASTARGYAEGVAQSYIAAATQAQGGAQAKSAIRLEPRFLYNQDFRSVFAMTPGVIMFLTMMIFAMVTALGVVREREIGSIINLSVSPASTGSFLVGKFLPYVAIGFAALVLMVLLAVFGLGVPIKGPVSALLVGGAIYVVSATTFGILVSTFVRSQVAAIVACAILTMLPALNFSGFLQPISNLSPTAQVIGLGFPSSWFQQISIGAFTKGLPWEAYGTSLLTLALFPFIYLALALMIMKKQER